MTPFYALLITDVLLLLAGLISALTAVRGGHLAITLRRRPEPRTPKEPTS